MLEAAAGDPGDLWPPLQPALSLPALLPGERNRSCPSILEEAAPIPWSSRMRTEPVPSLQRRQLPDRVLAVCAAAREAASLSWPARAAHWGVHTPVAWPRSRTSGEAANSWSPRSISVAAVPLSTYQEPVGASFLHPGSPCVLMSQWRLVTCPGDLNRLRAGSEERACLVPAQRLVTGHVRVKRVSDQGVCSAPIQSQQEGSPMLGHFLIPTV